MKERRMKLLMVTLVGVCLVSSGCTVSRTVPLHPPPVSTDQVLVPGRDVIIQLSDGTELRAGIVATDESGLTVQNGAWGQPRYLPFADMESLSVRQPSRGRTVMAAIGGTLLVAAGVLFHLLQQRFANEGNE
jgi:hypothetical protein